LGEKKGQGYYKAANGSAVAGIVGWTQEWGASIVELRAGDVVWYP